VTRHEVILSWYDIPVACSLVNAFYLILCCRVQDDDAEGQ
jgi:hypothetical protein